MTYFRHTAQALAELCDELDGWRARLDQQGPLLRRWIGQLRRDLEAEAVAASVSMEQVPVTVDEVRRILVGEQPATVSAQDQELVRGYRDAMEFVLRRADAHGFEWNRELVIGLHDRVLAGDWAAGAGQFATGPRWVYNQATGEEVFQPAEWTQAPELVDRACERMNLLMEEEHPAVAAGWIHVVIAAIHPFTDGNGRVARVLASLAMYCGGFKGKEFTSLEEWWGRHLADYYSAFGCLGRTFDSSADVTPFLEAHLRAQLSQVRALDLRKRVEAQIWASFSEILEEAELPARVSVGLWEAFNERRLTAGYYISVAEVSRPTATSDLRAAVEAGLLIAEGERRGRHYRASPQLYEKLGEVLSIEVPRVAGRARIVSTLTNRLASAGG